MKDEAGLRLVHWIQQTPINAYEVNCPLKSAKKEIKYRKWTSELQSLRREVRRFFNRCRADKK